MKHGISWALFALLTLGVGAQTTDDIMQQAMSREGRLEQDLARDQREKPVEVMRLAGLRQGWVVADIFSGDGYYSELLSHVVGEDGKVIAHNNQAWAAYAKKAIDKRYQPDRAPDVERLLSEADDLKLATESLDMAMMIMVYHDLYYSSEGWAPIDADAFMRQVFRALKPGGVLLIVDHSAPEGAGKDAAQDLHRIEESYAKDHLADVGFEFVASGDMLRNPKDDLSVYVFDEKVKGKTDRFVHVYRRPAE